MKQFKLLNSRTIFYAGILTLISLIFILSNLYWIINDSRPLSAEDMNLVENADYFLISSREGKKLIHSIFERSYPPVVPVLVYYSYLLFGFNDNSPLFVNLIFIPVLIISLYLLGKEAYSKKVGLVSVFIVLSFSPIIILSRIMYEQFVLISLFSFNLYFFLRTRNFKNRKYTILYAISFALCLLTRYTIFPFLIVPLIYFFLSYIFLTTKKWTKINDKSMTRNVLTFLLVVFFFVGPWYINQFGSIYNIYFSLKESNSANLLKLLHHKGNALCYLQHLIFNQLGSVNTLLILLILITFLKKIMKKPPFFNLNKTNLLNNKTIMFSFIMLFGYFFYSFFPDTGPQLTVPLLIPLAILFSSLIFKINKKLRTLILGVIILQSVLLLIPFNENSYFDTILYKKTLMTIQKNDDLCLYSIDRITLLPSHNSFLGILSNTLVIVKHDQQIYDIYRYIVNKASPNKTSRILFIVFDEYFDPDVVRHYAQLENFPLESYSLYYPDMYQSFSLSPMLIQEEGNFSWLNNFDYIVTPTFLPDEGYYYPWRVNKLFENNFWLIYNYLIGNKSNFSKINEYERPKYYTEGKIKVAIFSRNDS